MWLFSHISVVKEDICVKFGRPIDIGHGRFMMMAQYTSFGKIRDGGDHHIGYTQNTSWLICTKVCLYYILELGIHVIDSNRFDGRIDSNRFSMANRKQTGVRFGYTSSGHSPMSTLHSIQLLVRFTMFGL